MTTSATKTGSRRITSQRTTAMGTKMFTAARFLRGETSSEGYGKGVRGRSFLGSRSLSPNGGVLGAPRCARSGGCGSARDSPLR